MLTTLPLFLAAIAIIAYAILTEATDWIGRAEIIEKRWPRLWGLMNNRPIRLILLAVALVMIGHVIQDLRAGAEAPEVKFRSPQVPMIVPSEKESGSAHLRERAFVLALQVRGLAERELAEELTWNQLIGTEQEKHSWKERDRNQHEQRIKTFVSEYNEKYKVDAISLREQLLEKLPVGVRNDALKNWYQQVNCTAQDQVASELEQLARQLPDN